jgi:hypothetical protein
MGGEYRADDLLDYARTVPLAAAWSSTTVCQPSRRADKLPCLRPLTMRCGTLHCDGGLLRYLLGSGRDKSFVADHLDTVAKAGAMLNPTRIMGDARSDSVTAAAPPGGNGFASLQIDGPSEYHTDTTLGNGQILLEGIHATSYSMHNDLLSLYQGNRDVYNMHPSFQPTSGWHTTFGVDQIPGAVNIHAWAGDVGASGTALLVHT